MGRRHSLEDMEIIIRNQHICFFLVEDSNVEIHRMGEGLLNKANL